MDQYLYAKHPSNSPSPQPERKMKESLHRVKSGSSIGSLAAVSPALSPYIGKKDSSDYEVLRLIFRVDISNFNTARISTIIYHYIIDRIRHH